MRALRPALWTTVAIGAVGLALAVAASAQILGPGTITARPSSLGRFVYVQETDGKTPDGSDAQVARLARITAGLKSGPIDPKASDVATLMDTAALASPTSIVWIGASPKNARVLVYSAETPINALDHNLNVWNMATGAAAPLFNEHTASGVIKRGVCPSPVFQNYLTTAYADAPQPVKDALDFKIAVDGSEGGNVPAPQIHGWADDNRVVLTWMFMLQVSDGALIGPETFDLIVNWPAANAKATLTCAPKPAIPNPATALSANPTIRLHGKPVTFGGVSRSATHVAGIIAP